MGLRWSWSSTFWDGPPLIIFSYEQVLETVQIHIRYLNLQPTAAVEWFFFVFLVQADDSTSVQHQTVLQLVLVKLTQRTFRVRVCGLDNYVNTLTKEIQYRHIQYVFVSGRVRVLCVFCVTSLLSSWLFTFPRGLFILKSIFVPATLVTLYMKSANPHISSQRRAALHKNAV